MKVNFHYHFYSRIFISLLIFAFGFFLLQKSVDTRALIPNVYDNDTPIVGWAWNDKLGWIALNCANDFDGDGLADGNYTAGTYACGGPAGAWGLKMALVDHDSIPSTPEINYVQGCAWAGNSSLEPDINGSLPADAGYTTPGWICFSEPVPSAPVTDAPINGVLMSNASVNINYCQCQVKTGICDGSIPLRGGEACDNYRFCTGKINAIENYCQSDGTCLVTHDACSPSNPCEPEGNYCDSGHCSLSGDTCANDDECQYACRDDANTSFLLQGLCFNPANPAHRTLLDENRGLTPPASLGLGLDSCYINKECSANEECAYPQAGLVDGHKGRGTCMNDRGEEDSVQATCAYNFDCNSGFFCHLNMPNDFPGAPTTCEEAMCTGAYEPVTTSLSSTNFINALNPVGMSDEGYASILKMEPVSGLSAYDQANHLGFPIKFYIDNGVSSGFDFDADNPNDSVNATNPIRGCFNCYREKIYKCSVGPNSGDSCSCNQSDNSCADATSCGADPENNLCAVTNIESRCENCMEYFYYPEATNTCSLQPDLTCSATTPCGGYGSCDAHQSGDLKKVLTGFNCSDCIIDSLTNSCTLNASGINNNRCHKCQISEGESTLYRAGGVIYDNQHGLASTSTLCGWGYNAWGTGESNDTGFGWFNFSPRISTSTKPYFSVEKGNIYSKGRIATRYQPPISQYNASYLIESGGNITNFVSEASKDQQFQGELENRPIINFLTPNSLNTQFKNALGKLDYAGLLAIAKDVGGVNYNKYGSVIQERQPDLVDFYADNDIFDEAFNNKVIHMTNVPFDQEYGVKFAEGHGLEVKCGDGSGSSGAGIIIVEGNMKIKNNIIYESSCTIENLKQIPSLVWIVKGDVTIDLNVTSVAGTFIILGDDDSSRPNCSGPDDAINIGCGQFKSRSTGLPGPGGESALVVYGSVLAKKFVLERIKVDSLLGTPAEQFINDGRLQSNPPLGLTDMSRVIPRFSSY